MRLATQYIAFLNVEFPDRLTFDTVTQSWLCQARDIIILSKYKKICGHIVDTKLS